MSELVHVIYMDMCVYDVFVCVLCVCAHVCVCVYVCVVYVCMPVCVYPQYQASTVTNIVMDSVGCYGMQYRLCSMWY